MNSRHRVKVTRLPLRAAALHIPLSSHARMHAKHRDTPSELSTHARSLAVEARNSTHFSLRGVVARATRARNLCCCCCFICHLLRRCTCVVDLCLRLRLRLLSFLHHVVFCLALLAFARLYSARVCALVLCSRLRACTLLVFARLYFARVCARVLCSRLRA